MHPPGHGYEMRLGCIVIGVLKSRILADDNDCWLPREARCDESLSASQTTYRLTKSYDLLAQIGLNNAPAVQQPVFYPRVIT